MDSVAKIIVALADGCADCVHTVARGKGKVHCPLHEDIHPSLDVQVGDDGRPLLFCHSCRDNDGVISALRDRGLWSSRRQLTSSSTTRAVVNNGVPFENEEPRREVARYEYLTRDGGPAFTVIRYEPKGFSQRGPDGAASMDGVERVLYRLPSVLAAVDAGETVFIVEGERDAENLAAIGLCATTSPQGAGKWQDQFAMDLVNASVVIVADADDPGRKHAREVATSCGLSAKSIKVIEFPQKDSSDWLAAGGTREQLLAIVEKAPAWENDGRRILTGKDLVSMYVDVMARRMSGDLDYVGIPTGLGSLDKHIAYRVGDLILVVAATGVGKSAMLTTMQLDLDRRKIPSMFVSLEMSWIAMVDRMVTAGMSLESLGEREGLLVDEPSLTTARLETLARVARLRGVRIVFLDYAQRIVGDRHDSEYERVSAISNELARIAREARVCIVAAAQVSRAGADRHGNPPQLSDIRASGHLEQDAAVVLSLGRQVGEPDTKIAIQKNRWGRTGFVHVEFEGQRATFVSAIKAHEEKHGYETKD